jgi:hypothetical protein
MANNQITFFLHLARRMEIIQSEQQHQQWWLIVKRAWSFSFEAPVCWNAHFTAASLITHRRTDRKCLLLQQGQAPQKNV